MKANYKFNDADISRLDLTISITMTVDEWRHVMRIRAENYHYSHERLQTLISGALGDLTIATDKHYSVDHNRNKDVD